MVPSQSLLAAVPAVKKLTPQSSWPAASPHTQSSATQVGWNVVVATEIVSHPSGLSSPAHVPSVQTGVVSQTTVVLTALL